MLERVKLEQTLQLICVLFIITSISNVQIDHTL